MVRIVAFISGFFVASSFFAQNMWTWEHGDSINMDPVVGTKGVPHPDNFPGGGFEKPTWTDLDGNLWYFGGQGLSNNMWKFDPVTKEWTWMHGLDNVPVSYGVKTIANPTNVPQRSNSTSATWTDNLGNLWLYGGSVPYSPIWKYVIETNTWVWMHGDTIENQPPVYGVKGVADPNNHPGMRNQTSCSWVDLDNNLWVYGGFLNTGSATFYPNDLWKYDISTNQWTWVNGNSTGYTPPSYGQKGVPSATNTPGGRFVYANWVDSKGDLWLFGGSGISFFYADVWKYDISSNQWTWVNGSKTINYPGEYGEKCVASSVNAPPARYKNEAAFVDGCDNAWFFGGKKDFQELPLNDLWRYNANKNEFVWVSGENVGTDVQVLGTKGIGAPGNVPPGKEAYAFWGGKDGKIWIYGGKGSKGQDILWSYTPDVATAEFDWVIDEENPGKVSFTNTSFSDCNEIKSHEWDFGMEGITTDVSDSINPVYIFSKDGEYDVQLVITTCTGTKDSVTYRIKIENVDHNLFISNSFTPNGDDINDIFIPSLTGLITNFKFEVFNRWGESIFVTQDRNIGWDGTKNGKTLIPGIYTYLVEYEIGGNLEHKNGKISLVK